MMTHPTLHTCLRQAGTNFFIKFKPQKNNPFGDGYYYLEEGIKDVCIWNTPEAAKTLVKSFENLDLELVPAISILKDEIPELKKYIN